ncbi:MAG TPA: DinB family protein [Propionibacteriaceae bacterium]|nr:DinB family protein [Propionibacteriaceae bacterium]
MTHFHQQDLSGSRFEEVLLTGSRFTRVRLNESRFDDVHLGDVDIRGAYVTGSIRGAYVDLTVDAELGGLVVNGVDVVPYVEAELDRRLPERVLMRPTDPDGFRTAFATIEGLWEETVAHARTFPPADLHRSVDGEWSFIQTVRHLGFATACWVGMAEAVEKPWHPYDLPWDEAPGWDGVPWDRELQPTLDEVLAVRAERRAWVHALLDRLTEEELERRVSPTAPGHPDVDEPVSVAHCLRVVLNEEMLHRRFAERDLAVIEKSRDLGVVETS